MYAIKTWNAELDYTIRLETTPCHLGGVRWWFTCPLSRNGVACGRRVRKLYLSGRYFGCRHCHGLTYRSCQESDSRVYAALRGGLDLGRLGNPAGRSIAELGLALKVLTFEQNRLERLGWTAGPPGGRPRSFFPSDGRGERIAKYERHLHSLLTSTLHEQERLQARREGEMVPPPAVADVNVTVDAGPG